MSDKPHSQDEVAPASNDDISSAATSDNLTPLVQVTLHSIDQKMSELRSQAGKIMSLANVVHDEVADIEGRLTIERDDEDGESEYDTDREDAGGEDVTEKIDPGGAHGQSGEGDNTERFSSQLAHVERDEHSRSKKGIVAKTIAVETDIVSADQMKVEQPRKPEVGKWRSVTVEKNKVRNSEAGDKLKGASGFHTSDNLEVLGHSLARAREPDPRSHLVEWQAFTLERLVKDKLGWDDARLAEWLSAHLEFFVLQRLVGDLLGWTEADFERRLQQEAELALQRTAFH